MSCASKQHTMSLKRKRVAPPLFYDIESNTLQEPKKGKFDDVCRVCATPASASNDLMDIYSQEGQSLKLALKISKFLPIVIFESDLLPHMICINCRTIIFKIDSLYCICQKANIYFSAQLREEEPTTELLEVFDDEDCSATTYDPVITPPTVEPVAQTDAVGFTVIEPTVTTTYNPVITLPTVDASSSKADAVGFTVTVEEPTIAEEEPSIETSSWCLPDTEGENNTEQPTYEPDYTDEFWVKEECPSEFSDTEYNPTISDVRSFEPTSVKETTNNNRSLLKSNVVKKNSVRVATTKKAKSTKPKSVSPTKSKPKSVKAAKTKCVKSPKTKPKSVTPTKTQPKSVKATTTTNVKPTMTKPKSVTATTTKPKSVKATTTKVEPTKAKSVVVATTKSGRQVREVKRFENDSDEPSATESEGNEDSDDPDFNPTEENNPAHHYSGKFVPREKQRTTYNPVTALTPKKLPLKCEYCGTIFKIGASAECHYEIQHEKHLCIHCFVHYETRLELTEHYEDEHQDDTASTKRKYRKTVAPLHETKKTASESFACTSCDSSFSNKKNLKTHLKEKHKILMCHECSLTFDDHSEFEEHLESENHGKMCRICKIDFWDIKFWRQHAKEHYNYDKVKVIMPTEKVDLETSIDHVINATGVPVEINEFSTKNNEDNEENVQKSSVVLMSTSKSLARTKFPFKCDLCEEELSDPTVASVHYKEQHDKHMCLYCLKHYTTMEELNEHTENGHTFACALCSFKMTAFSVNALKKHFLTAHTDVYVNKSRVLECGICDMRFKRKKGELKKHMMEVHGKWICYVCLKCFNDENSFRAHLELEDHDFECKVCGADFDSRIAMTRHVAFHHPDHVSKLKETEKKAEDTTYICAICKTLHTKMHTMKRHYLEFHKKFFCFLCNLVFDTHSEIDSHSLEIHGCNTSWSYRCSECGKYYELEENLTAHIKTVHSTLMKKHLCEQCGKAFRSEFRLEQHRLRVHEEAVTAESRKKECPFCHKYFCADAIDKHVQRHTGVKEVVCADCGKQFYDTAGLKTHIRHIHMADRPYQSECPHCHLKLKKHKMKRHIEQEHTSDWTYICNQCNVYYKSDTEIWQHCFKEHGVIQGATTTNPFLRTSPYQCETCLIYLPNALKLENHKYLSHGAPADPKTREYEQRTMCCELCGEIVQRKQISTHMFRKHQVRRKYQCDLCDASFHKEDQKTRHLEKFHSEDRQVFCDICNRAFITRKRMTTHRRQVHFKEKEIPCTYCDKKFKSRNSMVKHTRMHSAYMPFKCETCDMGFHRKQYYERHMEKHEKNIPIPPPSKRRVEILLPEDEPVELDKK